MAVKCSRVRGGWAALVSAPPGSISTRYHSVFPARAGGDKILSRQAPSGEAIKGTWSAGTTSISADLRATASPETRSENSMLSAWVRLQTTANVGFVSLRSIWLSMDRDTPESLDNC